MHTQPDPPQPMGPAGMVLAIVLLLGCGVLLFAGLVLATGDPYHDKRFPEFLLLCLIFVVWGLGFGFVAIRMLVARKAKVASGKTVGIILVTPFYIYYVLLATKGELLEASLGILVLTMGCIFYVLYNRRRRRAG